MPFFQPRILHLFLFTECMIMVLFYIFSAHGWLAYLSLHKQKAELSYELSVHQKEIVDLQKEIEDFKENDFYKEKIAREQLHMARPDDIVIYLPKGIAA